MAQYNWVEIKTKYETGKYTMDELANQYGFNPSYAYRKARQNGWDKNRLAEKVENEADKRVINHEADKEKTLRLEYDRMINITRKGAFKALMTEKNFDRLKQFKIFSEILHNCRREQWEVNKILEVANEANLDEQSDALEQFVGAIENMKVID